MLIATYFKRPHTPIELPNGDGTFKRYFFRPGDPSVEGSEHVADVTDKAHIARLLQITEGYYIAHADALLNAAAVSATIRPPAAAVASAAIVADQVEPPGTNEAPPPPADELKQDAPPSEDAPRALLALSLKQFKSVLDDTPRHVLQSALEIEAGKGADERATYTKALRAALS
jgi:hypothetical protein